MNVKVIITPPEGDSVEKVAEVSRDGDLLNLVASAMNAYRKSHSELPLFDFSKIKIERVES